MNNPNFDPENKTITKIISDLIDYSGKNVFNPYNDECPLYDNKFSSEIRTSNLMHVLYACHNNGVDSIWLGRDMGYNGGRRTGIAFTDEPNLNNASMLWHDDFGRHLEKATISGIKKEKSATCIWKHITSLNEEDKNKGLLLWNVFPMHPYVDPGNILTNRAHSAQERKFGVHIFDLILTLLQPNKLLCIGNDAYNFSNKFSDRVKSIIKLRHPSYGGEKQLLSQLNKVYGINQQHYSPLLH